MMTQDSKLPRRALLLMAAVALPATPLLAQTQPPVTDVTVPPVTAPVQAPVTQPPVTQPAVTAPVSTTPPPSATVPTPATEAPATPERRTTTRTSRPTARTAPATRASAPARRATPAAAAPAPAASTAASPAPAAEAATPAPVAAPAPMPVPEEAPAAATGPSIWMWLIGGGLLALLAFALFNMRRHRARADEHDEYYEEAPVMAEPVRETDEPAPMMAAPAAAAAGAAFATPEPGYRREIVSTPMGDVVEPEEFAPAAEESVAVAEEADIADADPADVEALAATSAAPDGRPWLEFLMRPVRAGTSRDSAIVEFELTVGNTGTAPARDVRISTFMFAAGSAGESEMERMLIDPPADAAVAEVEIAAGDATRVEAAMTLPREGLGEGSVLPVVVADARYRLPDGSEGRTRASFEVGIPSEEGLDPFPTDRVSGLLEGVDARLHDEPERV